MPGKVGGSLDVGIGIARNEVSLDVPLVEASELAVFESQSSAAGVRSTAKN